MLFHVQEHRFTIPQIAKLIRELGLQFVKFEMPPPHRAAYHAAFPDDAAGTNLANWDQFEAHNPDLFMNMYRFWVRKPD